MVDRLGRRLATQSLRWDEVADALYLSRCFSEADARDEVPRPDAEPNPVPPDAGPEGPPPSDPDLPSKREESDRVLAASARRHTDFRGVARGSADEGSGWVESSAAPRELAAGRALRPLMRTAPSPRERELDEEGTAVRAAEERLWLPEYRPTPEHPFDLVLVIDSSSSMRIWRRTAREFRTLLERQGAFRDVRSVDLNTDHGEPGESRPTAKWRPQHLMDPTGRRIILMISDGVGKAWRTGAVRRLLTSWGRFSPVAVVQVLPDDMWQWTGIRSAAAQVRAHSAGLANRWLKWRPASDPSLYYPPGEVPVPVLALEPGWLARWANLLAGTDPRGVRLPVLTPPPDEPQQGTDEELSDEKRLLRFRTNATPTALRLAGLLAAAPLTMDVIHAVQRHLLPESGPSHLAEVMLGKLLRRVPNDDHVGNGTESQHIEYEFERDLRRWLLATSTRSDTVRVLHLVEDVLGSRVEVVSNLRQVIKDPENADEPAVSSENKPFVRLQYDVLAALAGPYARRANRLGESLNSYQDTRNSSSVTTTDSRTISGGDTLGGQEPLGFRASEISAEPIQDSKGTALTTMSTEQVVETRRTGEQATWGEVPLRNSNFIGRAELLDTLHDTLSQATPTAVLPGALHGMGGVGKTQIAVEYVYRYAAEYDLIWWIPSENTSEIQAALVRLAQQMQLEVEPGVGTAVPAVLEALRVGEPYNRWLLVFDNADRPEDIRQFFPRGRGHILVTSRNPQWSEVADSVVVDVFERHESRQLLKRRNADLADADADRVADVLGDLPLAVEQAAAWQAETGMPASEYLELLEDKRTELLESRPPADYPVAVAAAWNVSLDRLERDNPGALELLNVCAFYAPEPISRSLFTSVRGIPLPEALERTTGDPIQLNRAIRAINLYSLARIDHRDNTISLHRIVQTVLRHKLNPEEHERTRHSAHLLLGNADPGKPDSVDEWPKYAALLPHVRACEAFDCTDRYVRRLAINVAAYLFAFGDFNGALAMAEELTSYWGEKLGEDHQDTLIASRWRGRALRAVGRFEKAREVGERTLELLRSTLGPEHEETLLTMHAVASDLRAKGDFEGASRLNKTAYEIARKRFGEDDPDTLAAANNYALSLRLVGDFSSASRLDEDTWRRKRDVLGENHRHTLLTLDNWSVDLRESGRYVEARDQQEDTVARLRQYVGDKHPMTLAAIKNLAVARRKAGDHHSARILAQEALDGFRAQYGPTHPDAMSAAMNLSIDLRQANQRVASVEMGREVNDLYVQAWGQAHPFSLAGHTNLAVTLRHLGSLDEARVLNETALGQLRIVLGEDHPFTLVCATNRASDLAALGEHQAALELDEDIRGRSARVLGEDHPSTLAVTVNLALDLRELGRMSEADSLHGDVVTRFRRVLGPDHPATNAAVLNVRADCDIDPMQI